MGGACGSRCCFRSSWACCSASAGWASPHDRPRRGPGLHRLMMFGLFEQWPKRLPRWLPRWVLQVVAVAVAMPIGTAMIFALTTLPARPPFYHVPERMQASHRWPCLASWLRALGGAGRPGAAEGSAGAPSGAGVRAGAQRARAPGIGRAPAPAAGAGRAALPVQHAGQRAGAGRRGLAAGLGRAAKPDRLPARGRAAPERAGHHARPGAASWSGPISS